MTSNRNENTRKEESAGNAGLFLMSAGQQEMAMDYEKVISALRTVDRWQSLMVGGSFLFFCPPLTIAIGPLSNPVLNLSLGIRAQRKTCNPLLSSVFFGPLLLAGIIKNRFLTSYRSDAAAENL